MNEQSRGEKVLYTVFLLAVTAHTIVLLIDRFGPKEEKTCNCNKEHG